MTTNTNDGKNVQMVGRLSPFMEPGTAGWLYGMDKDGVMYRDYKMPPPDVQPGDKLIRILVDIRNHTILHVAQVVKDDESLGVMVNYVYTREGLFVHRVPVTEEVYNSVNRRLTMKAEHGPLDPHPGLLARTAERLRIVPQPGTLLEETVTKRGGVVYAVGTIATEIAVNHNTMHLLDMFKEAGMTLEESAIITAITDPKAKVEAMEKWLNAHGGMDRINEASLSRTLFGPVPGSKERAHDADMETAQRLCKTVVIGNVNYGRLAVSRVGGVPFLGDVDDLAELGLPAMYISRTPKFNADIKLLVHWKVGEQENCTPLYALEKEDINDLGLLLSSRGHRVAAHFMAANLKVWVNGIVEREYTSPEEFFACTPELVEQAKF